MVFRRTAILAAALVLGLFESRGVAVDLADLQKAIGTGLQHPYLHFNSNDLPALRERVQSHPRAREVYRWVRAEANRLLDLPISLEVPQRYRGINPYFDGQDAFGTYRDELARGAYLLAFVYQMTGEKQFAHRAYEFADAVSALDSWVDSWDKFRWLYWMGKPFGAKWNDEDDNEIVYSFELGAASVSGQIAAVYDWLYPVLDKYQRKRLANALLENAVLRVRGNYDYHWWAHAWRTNWLPVCFSGVGQAALALVGEDPRLLDVVAETSNRLNRFFDEAIGIDGDYQEGLGYWRYGMENAVLFAAALKKVTAGKADLFQNPRLKTTIQFPMFCFTAPQGSIPFGDAREPLEGSWELFNKLAEEYSSPQAKWLAQSFTDFDPSQHPSELDLFSIIWPEARVKPSLPSTSQPMSIHFRSTDWLVMRASWENPDHPLLAAKGGIHDDPHHGHLDAGQFAIKYRGEWFIKELGYMSPYGLGYWDYRRRFKDYVHANSLGHNVVFVNGEQQEYGKQYFGKVTRFETSSEQDYAIIDAARAYPGKELKSWRRHIVFHKPDLFAVLDEVVSPPGAQIVVRIHPGVSFQAKGKDMLLAGKTGKMAVIPLQPDIVAFKPDGHPYLAEQRNAKFHRIPYWDLTTEAAGTQTQVLTLFVPVETEDDVPKIRHTSRLMRQGNRLRCLVNNRGKSYVLDFDIAEPANK